MQIQVQFMTYFLGVYERYSCLSAMLEPMQPD